MIVALLMIGLAVLVFAVAIGIIYVVMSWGLRQGTKDDSANERRKDR